MVHVELHSISSLNASENIVLEGPAPILGGDEEENEKNGKDIKQTQSQKVNVEKSLRQRQPGGQPAARQSHECCLPTH